MVCPGGNEIVAEILSGQAARLIAKDLARGLTGTDQHRQGARQLTVPGLKGVPAAAAIAELVAVVAPFDDVQHSARGHRIGIVINCKDSAQGVHMDAEGVPEPGGKSSQFHSGCLAPANVAAFALIGNGRSIAACEPIADAEIFTQTEEEVALQVECDARKTVVRIVALGLQEDDAFFLIGSPVSICVSEPEDFVAGSKIDGAIGMNGNVHRGGSAFEKSSKAVGPSIAVGIFQEADAIVLGTRILLGTKMGVTFDGQESATFVEGDCHWMNDLRLLSEEDNFQPGIDATGSFTFRRRGLIECRQYGEGEQQKTTGCL